MSGARTWLGVGEAPLVHADWTTTWGIHSELAEFLDRHVDPETVALETGAGLSTLVILRKGGLMIVERGTAPNSLTRPVSADTILP